MIATCTSCQARYQLQDDRIPRRMIRVRCPACQAVFALDGTLADAAPEPVTQAPAFEPAAKVEPMFTPEPVQDPVPDPVPEAAPIAAAIATLDEPVAQDRPARRRRCKEEMLARALVSDILVYNRDTRDAGLKEGNLLEALGGEIKKSWELYKEKVTPEVANSTNYFREALNEILAEGDSVF